MAGVGDGDRPLRPSDSWIPHVTLFCPEHEGDCPQWNSLKPGVDALTPTPVADVRFLLMGTDPIAPEPGFAKRGLSPSGGARGQYKIRCSCLLKIVPFGTVPGMLPVWLLYNLCLCGKLENGGICG